METKSLYKEKKNVPEKNWIRIHRFSFDCQKTLRMQSGSLLLFIHSSRCRQTVKMSEFVYAYSGIITATTTASTDTHHNCSSERVLFTLSENVMRSHSSACNADSCLFCHWPVFLCKTFIVIQSIFFVFFCPSILNNGFIIRCNLFDHIISIENAKKLKIENCLDDFKDKLNKAIRKGLSKSISY